ncbi:MAG: ABC transporter substrate-binding protein [Longimicrobiales bacterium]
MPPPHQRPDPTPVGRSSRALVLVALALVSTSCGGDPPSNNSPASRAARGIPPGAPWGTLTIARPQDIRDLNPLRQANNATSEVTYQVHEGLFTLSPDQELVGALATSWELLEDGRTYRLQLREGVTFHSGEPFNAEAVRWNFEKQLKTEPLAIGAGLVPPYHDISIVDDHTIDITLEEPHGVFVQVLAAPLFMIVDPARYQALGERYATDPSGTGPFRFVSWTPDQRVVLEANQTYWDTDNGPGVEELVFEVIPEAAARIIALRNGEVDLVFSVPAEDVPALSTDPDFEVIGTASMRIVYLGLNTADPVLSDVRVRQALGHAIDRNQIVQIIGDNGVRAEGIGVPEALGFGPTARAFDPEAANRLLDAAGWRMNGDYREKDGQRLSIAAMVPGSFPGEVESMLVVQSQWKNVGVEMLIEQIESGAATALRNEEAGRHEADPTHVPRYQAWTAGEGIRTGEIGYITERPKCDQGFRNWERFCDPAYDEAFERAQSPAPLDERLEGYAGLNDILREQSIRLPIFVIQSNKAMSTQVQGFVPNPNDALNLRGVTVGG